MNKKNIRKFFVILCAMLLAFSFAACKGNEDNDTEDKKKSESVKDKDDKDEDDKDKDDKDKDTKGSEEDDKNQKGDDQGSATDTKGDDEGNKGTQIDNPGTVEDDEDNKGQEGNKGNQGSTITMKTSGKSANGKISFVVDEDEYLVFSVDPSYGLTEDAMMYIVPKGEYALAEEADEVEVDYEFCEDEPDENGRAIFEFFIYDITPGEYDMVLTTDFEGYVCAKWSIAIESNDVYEVDLSKLKEYDKPEGFSERPQYKELTEGEWPSDVLPKPEGCTLNGGGENALGMIVYAKWNSKQDVLNYIEVLEGMGIEATIDLKDEEEINWYADEIRVIYTVSDDDDDIILIR